MSVKRKVRFGAAAIGGIFVIQAGLTAYSETRMSGVSDDEKVMAQAVHNHMQADMDHDAIRSSVFRALHGASRQDQAEIETAGNEVTEFGVDLQTSLRGNQNLPLDPDIKAQEAQIASMFQDYLASAHEVIEAAKHNPAAAEALLGGFDQRFRALEDAQDKAATLIEARVAEVNAESDSVGTRSLILLAGTSLLMAAALAWAVRQLGRKVIQPIDAIATQLDDLSNGDYSHPITTSSTDREIVAIQSAAEAFRYSGLERQNAQAVQAEVVSKLGAALGVVAEGDLTHRIDQAFPSEYEALREAYNGSVTRLGTLLSQVRASATTVAGGAAEIQTASSDLATRNERQAASVEETAAAMNQITSALSDTANTANEVRGSAAHSHRQASEGGDVVREAIAAMASIEQSSNEISKIVGVIDGIAFQTNLLALNAGVEAARAGESGKGFAVVATEVRALAQRSADAARDIKDLIAKATSQVHSGVSLVDRTGTVLHSIIDGMSEINGLFEEISTRTEAQSANMGHINQAVSDMDRMTQQNAAMVEQSSASSRGLAAEAEQLLALVAQFKTPDGHAPRVVPLLQRGHEPISTPTPAPRLPQVSGNLAMASDPDWDTF